MLQIEQIFTNVPKGLVAKREDWVKSFATDDMNKVIEEVGFWVICLTLDPSKGGPTDQQSRTDASAG